MAEILLSFNVCLSVCQCTADRSLRPMDGIIEMPDAVDSKLGKHVSRE